MNIKKLETSPKDLDAQSVVVIDEWVIVDSPKHKESDEYYAASKGMLQTGSDAGFIMIDSNGRLWVMAENENQFYPYHYERGNKLYGLRIATQAAN